MQILSERARNINPSPTLAIDAQAKSMQAAGLNVINFGAGEPDFDTPEYIKAGAIEALKRGETKYTPVAGTEKLRQAIAQKLKSDQGLDYAPGQIVVSCGAKHSLYNAIQVLCQEHDEVILPVPYWVSYLEQIRLAGATPVLLPARQENGFKLTGEELAKACTSRTKLVLINSPSNPTGALYTREELAALAEVILDKNLMVISDEIYEKLVYDGKEFTSITSLGPEIKEHTVLINGFSKAYAMTGWRLGYAACAAQIARAMTDLQSHSTSNSASMVQAAGVAALTGTQEPLREMVHAFQKRRDLMLEGIREIPGLICHKPDGAFYLFPAVESYLGKSYRGRKVESAQDLAALLLEEARVAVVPGEAFGDPRHIRLSYATSPEAIVEGMNRMKEIMQVLWTAN